MDNQKANVCEELIHGLDANMLVANLWSTGKCFMRHAIAQYPVDLILWDIFLTSRPTIRSVVELGSAAFGLSLYLALQCYQRGLEFRTFDINASNNLNSPLSNLVKLRNNFIMGDIFGDVREQLTLLLRYGLPHPILLYCDDGDKPREFKGFVPCLRAGDYVGVHDWGREIDEDDVSIFGDAVVPLYWDMWRQLGSITRFMKVMKDIEP